MWTPSLRWPRFNVRDRRLWIVGAIAVVVALAYAASFMIDEPLRRSIERRMNARLKGYRVHLGGARFHPHGLSLDLLNLTVVQDANPDPPVLEIPRLGASVQWRELIRLKLVANIAIDRPSLDVNLAHLRQEAKEEVPLKERGWQDAFSNADLRLTGLTNQSAEAPARPTMRGKFMGSGPTEATLAFRPHQKGGDLNLKVSIESTDMVAMNDLLRSYGKVEVAAGEFSLYSEVAVRDGAIRGYVKPLFKDVVVEHDPEKQPDKTFGEKLKEHLLGGAAKILKNRPRKEVATKADLSGRLDRPQTSIVQVAMRLVENAFFKAILPGFDRTAGAAPSPPRRPSAERPSSSRAG